MNPSHSASFPVTHTARSGWLGAWRLCIGAVLAAGLTALAGCGGGGREEAPTVAFESSTQQMGDAKRKPDAPPRLVAQPVSMVNATTAGEQEVRAIGALAEGGYAVAWRSGQDLYFQRYDSSGNKMGMETPIQLVVDPEDGLSQRLETSIAVLSDGTFLVAYVVRRDIPPSLFFSEVGLYVQRFDQTGAQILPATQIDSVTSAARRPTFITAVRVLPMSEGGYVVSWGTFHTSATVGLRTSWSAQRFDGDNRPVSDRMGMNADSTVDTFCRIIPDANDGYTTYCSGTSEEDWSPTGLRVTHFDATQSMVQILTGWPGSAFLLPLQDRRFVLYTSDGGGAYRQFLDRTGAPVGERTAVAPMPTSGQLLADGSYVVFRSAGSGTTAQRFTPGGEPMGDTFPLPTAGAQPALAPLAEGGFAAAWSAPGATTDLDVYTQQFVEIGHSRRKTCLASAKAKGLKGQERKAFMRNCLP